MVRTRAALALVLSLLLIPLFGCGDESATGTADQTVESTDPDAENDLIQAMIDRESIVFRTGSITLNDLFPTSGADSAAESAFLANVVEVTPGRAFKDILEDDTSHVEQVPFDDAAADWRTFHVRVEIIERYLGDVQPGDHLALGLAFGSQPPLNVVADGLVSIGRIVAFTKPGSFVVDYDPTITPVLWDGAFLSPVDGEQVPFPALSEGGQPDPLVSLMDTLTELRILSERVLADGTSAPSR